MEEMSVFVKIDEYDEVLDVMKHIRKKLDEAKETLVQLHELKKEEDQQLEMWQNALMEVQKKVSFVSHSLGEPQEF